MKKRSRFTRRLKMVFHRGKSVVTLALLAVIVLSTVALAGLYVAIQDARDEEANNRAEAIRLEQENRDLENRIGKLGSAESFREIAREELGLEDPDAVVYIMEEAE